MNYFLEKTFFISALFFFSLKCPNFEGFNVISLFVYSYISLYAKHDLAFSDDEEGKTISSHPVIIHFLVFLIFHLDL